MIGQHRIGGGMALVKPVTGKGNQNFKNTVGVFFLKIVLYRAFDKPRFLLLHNLFFLLSHCAPQQVRLTEAVAADTLRNLHNLFLIDDNAVGFRQYIFEAGVGILNFRCIEF